MTNSQTRCVIVCLLSASMWASLVRESNGDSVAKLEREVAGLNHKVKILNIENDNLQSKINSIENASRDLGKEKDILQDKLEEERARLAKAEEVKSAICGELKAGFGRAELAFNELKHELAAVRNESGRGRISTLIDDLDEDFKEIQSRISNEQSHIHEQAEIHEQLKQRLAAVQARTPELIERWIRDKFPNTSNTYGLGIASKSIFLLAVLLSLVVLYTAVKMAFGAVARAGRIGFTIGFSGLASLLSGVYTIVGIPLTCIGLIVIFGQAFRNRKHAV